MRKFVSLVLVAMAMSAPGAAQDGSDAPEREIAYMLERCAASENDSTSSTGLSQTTVSAQRTERTERPASHRDCRNVSQVYLGMLNARNLEGYEREICSIPDVDPDVPGGCTFVTEFVERVRNDTHSVNGQSVQLGLRFQSADPAFLVMKMSELCDGGVGNACHQLGEMVSHKGGRADFNHIEEAPDFELATNSYRKGCDLQNDRACRSYRTTWGRAFHGGDRSKPATLTYFEAACETGATARCEDADFIQKQYDRALERHLEEERREAERAERRRARQAAREERRRKARKAQEQ